MKNANKKRDAKVSQANVKSIQVIKATKQASDETPTIEQPTNEAQATNETPTIEQLEAQAIRDEANKATNDFKTLDVIKKVFDGQSNDELKATLKAMITVEQSERDANYNNIVSMLQVMIAMRRSESDEVVLIRSIQENYQVKLDKVNLDINALVQPNLATAKATEFVEYGKKLEVLQKAKAKLEKDKLSEITKAKKTLEANAKANKAKLENDSYAICYKIAQFENDSFNLNVSANAYNQKAIWTFNAFVSLDGLFDTDKHSVLIAKLKDESDMADKLSEYVKVEANLIASELATLQKENASLLTLSVMKKARKDARDASDKLFKSRVGERPTIDEATSDEATSDEATIDEATSDKAKVILDEAKRELLRTSSETITA